MADVRPRATADVRLQAKANDWRVYSRTSFGFSPPDRSLFANASTGDASTMQAAASTQMACAARAGRGREHRRVRGPPAGASVSCSRVTRISEHTSSRAATGADHGQGAPPERSRSWACNSRHGGSGVKWTTFQPRERHTPSRATRPPSATHAGQRSIAADTCGGAGPSWPDWPDSRRSSPGTSRSRCAGCRVHASSRRFGMPRPGGCSGACLDVDLRRATARAGRFAPRQRAVMASGRVLLRWSASTRTRSTRRVSRWVTSHSARGATSLRSNRCTSSGSPAPRPRGRMPTP